MSIQSELERIQNAKSSIRTAIQAKGVTVPSNALISTYSDYIAAIQTGGGGEGGESVPTLPDSLIVSTLKTSVENTPDYVGIYTKQNAPSDWTDVYYCCPGADEYAMSYYICCVAGQDGYNWIISNNSPQSQSFSLSNDLLLRSVISEVPMAPQDIRWETDTAESSMDPMQNEDIIVIVEEYTSGGGQNGYSVSGAGSNDINGVYVQNGTMSGQPMYQKQNGDAVLFYDGNGYWRICDNITEWDMTLQSYYQNSTITGTYGLGMHGSQPCPTVTAL